MPNHLKAGELYAFATNDGSCLVGKILRSKASTVDIFIYDRTFQPLSAKSDVVAALVEMGSPDGYKTNLTRRDFALMYPLWLSHQEVAEKEEAGISQNSITICGRPMRFHRRRPYWEPVIILIFTWLILLVFSLAVCVPNSPSLPSSLFLAVVFSASIAIPLGGTIAFMSVVFRWLEAVRTGISIKTNPTLEFALPMSMEETFTQCRDRLGGITRREFDFVDRHSGYIQARLQDHLLVRLMFYQVDGNETGIIASCFDLKGGTFGADMWALKNVVNTLMAEDGETVSTQGPLVIGGISRRLFWFAMTALFACVSAMFLKAAISGELSCLPLLLVTISLTGLAGFYLFRPHPETAGP